MVSQACLVLKGVTEEVTQYGDDLHADAKRGLLAALMQSLDTVLPFLQQCLEHNFGAASEAAASGRMPDAQSHASAVTAALGAFPAVRCYSSRTRQAVMRFTRLLACCPVPHVMQVVSCAALP